MEQYDHLEAQVCHFLHHLLAFHRENVATIGVGGAHRCSPSSFCTFSSFCFNNDHLRSVLLLNVLKNKFFCSAKRAIEDGEMNRTKMAGSPSRNQVRKRIYSSPTLAPAPIAWQRQLLSSSGRKAVPNAVVVNSKDEISVRKRKKQARGRIHHLQFRSNRKIGFYCLIAISISICRAKSWLSTSFKQARRK
jgi:hypothetical protein